MRKGTSPSFLLPRVLTPGAAGNTTQQDRLRLNGVGLRRFAPGSATSTEQHHPAAKAGTADLNSREPGLIFRRGLESWFVGDRPQWWDRATRAAVALTMSPALSPCLGFPPPEPTRAMPLQ